MNLSQLPDAKLHVLVAIEEENEGLTFADYGNSLAFFYHGHMVNTWGDESFDAFIADCERWIRTSASDVPTGC